jgi:hypothetical protein
VERFSGHTSFAVGDHAADSRPRSSADPQLAPREEMLRPRPDRTVVSPGLERSAEIGHTKTYVQRFLTLATLFVIVATAAFCTGSEEGLSSVYTGLTADACTSVSENKETGSTVRRCPGVGGYQLLLADDDSRMSVTVVTPDEKEHPLNYWTVITPHFSTLGGRAEWRVMRQGSRVVPVGLIVRVDARESESSPQKKTSYLAVAKIGAGEICVTRKIASTANANQQARDAADHAGADACLEH